MRVTRSRGKRKKRSKEDEDEKKVSEHRFIYKVIISDLRDCEKKKSYENKVESDVVIVSFGDRKGNVV